MLSLFYAYILEDGLLRKFEISTDSTADLYQNEIKEKELFFLPLTFTLTDKGVITEYKDEFSRPEEYSEYYDKLRTGVLSKTSMNNPFVHEEHFRKMAEAGVKDAVHFTISYGLCRTVDVAREAVETVKKDFPDFNCYCVECSTTTIGQLAMVNVAADMLSPIHDKHPFTCGLEFVRAYRPEQPAPDYKIIVFHKFYPLHNSIARAIAAFINSPQ